jgi:peptidoglycan/LPS O-acetylase OafA/YrhL
LVQQALAYPISKDLPVAGALALAASMIAISLIMGTITYHGIEVTGRQYLRRFLGVWREGHSIALYRPGGT